MGSTEPPSPLDATLLVAVVDVNPRVWAERDGLQDGHLALARILEELCLFLNAFRIVNAANRIAVVIAYEGGARMMIRANDRFGESLHDVLVPALLRAAVDAPQSPSGPSTTALSSALSIALCHANRHVRPDARHQRAQVLALAATADDSRQYNSAMNCIFAAQRASIIVDACMLGPPSAFLQQAAHITGGVYLQPPPDAEAALAQLLITAVLPDAFARTQLRKPPPHDVDFRAACFLTSEMLERAHVCSVCLSVFHRGAMPECPACRARFRPPAAVGRPGKRKRRPPPAPAVTASDGAA